MTDTKLSESVKSIDATGPRNGSTWRHRRGSLYRVLCCAVQEADKVPVVVYHRQPDAGVTEPDSPVVWTRPLTEFMDGRFIMVANG